MQKSIFSADYDAFCSLLKRVREEAGLSQYQLADRLNADQSWISKCERGERRIDVVELLQFCVALEIEPEEFMRRLSLLVGK